MSRRSSSSLPKEGSIEQGEVVRIEPYGAFVQLQEYPHLRGLLHISQISHVRLDQVEDALSLNERVWVKVMEITKQEERYKIRLSMKNVAQDGSALETAAQMEAQQQVSQAIEQNLSSSIGMGFARDPMAGIVGSGSSSSNRLVLKKDQQQSSTLINGYALVDDTEGELPVEQQQHLTEEPVKPMGRGRGTTLPAWMTKQQQEENGPTKAEDEESRSRKKSKRKRQKKERKTKSKSSKRERKHSDDDSDEEDKRRHRKHHKKRHRRSRSESDDDSSSRRRHKRRHRHSSSRERHRSDSEDDVQFESVEDAKKLIREIEERRKRSHG